MKKILIYKKGIFLVQVDVVGLTWGDYNEDLFRFDSGSLDLIIGSDLFFDPEVFEPLTETITYLLTQNPKAQVKIQLFAKKIEFFREKHEKRRKLHMFKIFTQSLIYRRI